MRFQLSWIKPIQKTKNTSVKRVPFETAWRKNFMIVDASIKLKSMALDQDI